jgi:chromate transporter
MVVALGAVYVAYGGIGWMQAVFYGVGAAVIGIIAISAWKLTVKNIGKDKLLWPIFFASAAVTVVTKSEIVWLFLGAGILVWLVRAPPRVRHGADLRAVAASAPIAGALAAGALDWPLLAQIAGYFAYAGSFVFGSGLAIVPFLYGGVVQEHHWLNDRQFVDAVAVAMITPGPVVITTGFIGYLVAGFWGAVVAALATFVPCYLFTIVPAPYFKKHGRRPGIVAFVDGVTAAAIGAITGAVIVLGQRSISDWVTAAMTVFTVVVLWRFKKVPEPAIVLVAALVGVVAHPLMTHG